MTDVAEAESQTPSPESGSGWLFLVGFFSVAIVVMSVLLYLRFAGGSDDPAYPQTQIAVISIADWLPSDITAASDEEIDQSMRSAQAAATELATLGFVVINSDAALAIPSDVIRVTPSLMQTLEGQ